MAPIVLALLGASSLAAGAFAVSLAQASRQYRRERSLTVAVTWFIVGLIISLPAAFLWQPARWIHVSANWGWLAFIPLLLGAAGFAVGRALPADRRPSSDAGGADLERPWTARRAIARGYRDALAFPWPRTLPPPPTWRTVEQNLAADLRDLLNQLGADDAR